ncbi:MAG: hypothetical protein EP324_02965, partial [Gammaproteobacteria bacterium]
CLNMHPMVVESVALGAADADWGEWVAALVVVAEPVDETELVKWCRAHLSEYKVPKRILFVNELKKGPSGKILQEQARSDLKKLLETDQGDNETSDHGAIVLSLAARSFKLSQSELSTSSSPENTVGWDSLAHMDLVVALEKHFGIRFSPRDIMQIDSLQRAIELVTLKVAR